MPSPRPSRQRASRGDAWFVQPASLRLLGAIQRDVAPHAPHPCGRVGLVLHACATLRRPRLDARLSTVLSLVREGRNFGGDLRCSDGALPFATASVSLVYAAHVLESSAAPGALLDEIARVLRPEGVALIVVLNPYSAARLHWARRGPSALAPGAVGRMSRRAGLQVDARRWVGPYWRGEERWREASAARAPLRPLRAAYLIQARRREPGAIPARPLRTRRFHPGLHPG